ncbi:MAG: DUF3108 domain-containing protein, partial [Saprospiraceae bacterium]|nr:DUF3108 domain-containing protein [Saprospiraceae bacterium]
MSIRFIGQLIFMTFPLLGALQVTDSALNADRPPAGYELNCESENFSFQPGEELVYKIYYNLNFIWIPAGEIKFNVFNGPGTYEFTAYGTTYPSYEWFYKVHDIYRTTVDKSSLLPTYSMRHLQEGGYRLYEEVVYDQEEGEAKVLRGRDKASATDRGIVDFGNCANDIVSLLYKLRNVDMEALKTAGEMPVDFFMGKEYNVKLRY